ncbi:RHBDL3 [Symbiodinium microadriaticum]|nr:RHBDL3 [Symbiodinium sp. KB8]CAE7349530.1 RHBDL3 [Symbiodinium microadriaticum]
MGFSESEGDGTSSLGASTSVRRRNTGCYGCCRRCCLKFVDAEHHDLLEQDDSCTAAFKHFFSGRSLDRRSARKQKLARSIHLQGRLREAAGEMDPSDLGMLEGAVSGLAVEDQMDSWPIFIVLQSLAAVTLWVVFASQDEAGFEQALAGLESLATGWTTMLTHRDCTDLRWEAWRWLSYQYTHSGVWHIGFNTLLVLVVGIRLEMYHGHFRTFLVFNLGVVCAALNFAVTDGHAELVGMSGGAYALMGMTFGSLMLNWSDTRYRRPELAILLILFAMDVGMAYWQSVSSEENSTSHSAHFGGYLSGFILGIVVGRNLDEEEAAEHAASLKCERRVQRVMLLLGLALLIFALVWVAQWPPRTLYDLTPWCWHRQVFNQTLFPEFSFHCVRCQDAECIDEFSQMNFVEEVSFRVCAVTGWRYSQVRL